RVRDALHSRAPQVPRKAGSTDPPVSTRQGQRLASAGLHIGRHCEASSVPASRTARSAAAKPILECVPSQNGLLVEPPHRHSAMVDRSTGYSDPSASMTVTWPFTRYGPFSSGVIVTAASLIATVYINQSPVP